MSRATSAWILVRVVLSAALLACFAEWAALADQLRMPARWGELARPGFAVALWLCGTSILVTLIDLAVWDRMARRTNGVPLPRLLRDTVAAILYLLTLMALLGLVFDQSVTGFWTASGALSIVLGLALRSIILDLFTGVALSVERSYRIGDWLEIVDRVGPTIYGRVIGTNWRATRLELLDKRVLMVPNSRLGLMMVMNCSVNPAVRAEILISLEADVPQARAIRIIEAGARATLGTSGILLAPPPRVMANSAASGGVEYRIWVWQEPGTAPPVVRSLVLESVLRQLAVAGLKPFGTRQDVRLVRSFGTPAETVDHAQRLRLVRHVDLFASTMSADEQDRLAEAMSHRHLSASATLLVQGDEGASLFILAEGLLEVFVSREGGPLKVGQIEAGQVVGEMSLLTGAPRSATVRAVTDCVLYEVSAEILSGLLAERPSLAESFSRVVAHRVAANVRATEAAAGGIEDPDSAARQLLSRIRRFFGKPRRADAAE